MIEPNVIILKEKTEMLQRNIDYSFALRFYYLLTTVRWNIPLALEVRNVFFLINDSQSLSVDTRGESQQK